MPAFVWLIVVWLASAPLIYLGGRWSARPALSGWLALAALCGACAPFALAAQSLAVDGPAAWQAGAAALRFDGISQLMSALALALGAAAVLVSSATMRGNDRLEGYYALLVVMLGALCGLVCAGDLFNLWAWFEVMAVSSYLLVAFHREEPATLEAGVKYLVQSAAGSALVLFGVALVLAAGGTLDLTAVRLPPGSPLGGIAAALFVAGFGVKAALVPLHTWLADAHAQAPGGISALLSGIVIEAGLVAILRACAPLADASLAPRLGTLLMLAGALNMLAGNLLALRQVQVKRMLAFSSIAQVGYMAFGFGVALGAGTGDGAAGAYFHLLNHGLMKGLAFVAAGAFLFALRPGAHAPLLIADLAGAAGAHRPAAWALSVALLGLGGLPPLAGFMSKWQVLAAGFATAQPLAAVLAVFGILNSVLSLAYYAPVVGMLYRHAPSDAVRGGGRIPARVNVLLVALAVAIIAIGLWPPLLRRLVEPAAAALLASLGS